MCRDLASGYAEAVRSAAPNAIQVADRFHLWRNLSTAVEKIAAAHRRCLRPPEEQPADATSAEAEPAPVELEGLRAAKTHQRHAAVHELLATGVTIQAIAEALHLDPKTVRRYPQTTVPTR